MNPEIWREIDPLLKWIEFDYSRSSGPGGQNVNKLATRATLRLDFEQSPLFSAHERGLIRTRLAKRLAADGRLQVVAQSERSQTGNRDAAIARLIELLARALHVSKSRRATRPTNASRRRRLEDKRRRSGVKSSRRGGEEH